MRKDKMDLRQSGYRRTAALFGVALPLISLCLSPSLAILPASVAKSATEASPMALTRLGYADLPKLQPVKSATLQREWAPLMKERRVAWAHETFEGTPAERYQRAYPFFDLCVDIGHGPNVFGDKLPGAESVFAERNIYSPDGKKFLGKETLWRWQVPQALRYGWLESAGGHNVYGRNRFHPVVLTDSERKTFTHLYLFDSSKGLLWERDLRSLPPIPSGNGQGQAVSYTSIVDFNISLDGERIMVLLSPPFTQETLRSEPTAETGSRLLLFDRQGRLISAIEFVGMTVSRLRSNETGTSFLARFTLDFQEGVRNTKELLSGSLLLNRQGSLVGVLGDDKGNPASDFFRVSDDDGLVIGENNGVIYKVP